MKKKLFALLAAMFMSATLLIASPAPSSAYTGGGDVLVWGSGGRSCWGRVNFGQGVFNQPVANGFVHTGQCTVSTPMSVRVLVQFDQWPYAVVGSWYSYGSTASAALGYANVEASGACLQVKWWDNEESSWGCKSVWT